MPAITNVTCSRCSTPLLAFRRVGSGRTAVTSYGAEVELAASGPHHAVCRKCGHLEPFDRALLPEPTKPAG